MSMEKFIIINDKNLILTSFLFFLILLSKTVINLKSEMKVEKLEIKNKLIEAISTVTKAESDKKIDKAIKKVAENLSEMIIEDRKKAKKKAEKKAKQEEKNASKTEKIKPKKTTKPKAEPTVIKD